MIILLMRAPDTTLGLLARFAEFIDENDVYQTHMP
jgi:hypothetical protein